MEDPTRAETLWEEHFKCLSSSYRIMTINMGVKSQGEGIEDRRRERIKEIIKDTSASVIFCQEPPGNFNEVVVKCGNNGHTYKFVPKVVCTRTDEAVVMWCETDFQGEEVTVTESIVIRIKKMRPNVDVNRVLTRTAMVKLTSIATGASFLAVSWHGPWTGEKEETKPEALYDLICVLRHVCKMKNLSSFIVGGDFNLDTSKVDPADLTEFEEVMKSSYKLCTRDKERMQSQSQPKPGRKFVPFKDTFIFTVPSNKFPTTGDIMVSSVKPLDFENNGSDNALLDHAPVMGDLKLVCSYRNTETFTEDKTTNEKDRPGSTPETTARKADVGSSAAKKLDFEYASSSSSGQPSRAMHHDRYVIWRGSGRPAVDSTQTIHAKVDDQQTAEIEERLAKLHMDGIHGSVSQAQPTEPHSQETKVSASLLVEQGSGRESTSEEKKKGKDKKERKR